MCQCQTDLRTASRLRCPDDQPFSWANSLEFRSKFAARCEGWRWVCRGSSRGVECDAGAIQRVDGVMM
jgi:hypothetical protein